MANVAPNKKRSFRGNGSSSRKPGGRLLLMEPAPLLKWSLATYLERWFDVIQTSERRDAEEILRGPTMDALVISDEFDKRDVDWIEHQARTRNPDVRVIRTVTQAPREPGAKTLCAFLEKPFDLAELAALLGVYDVSSSDSGE